MRSKPYTAILYNTVSISQGPGVACRLHGVQCKVRWWGSGLRWSMQQAQSTDVRSPFLLGVLNPSSFTGSLRMTDTLEAQEDDHHPLSLNSVFLSCLLLHHPATWWSNSQQPSDPQLLFNYLMTFIPLLLFFNFQAALLLCQINTSLLPNHKTENSW